MRIVDLSMTVEECDSAPFAKDEAYFKLRPIVTWEEKGGDYEKAEKILTSGMRVHRTILPKVVYQIENLTNLHAIPSKVKVIALPAKWKTESAPARVIALVD